MKNVSGVQVVTTAEAVESPLPAEIQEALGELVGAAREGLLALSVGVGLRVVHELMEAEVTEIVGPKGKHDSGRTASRHGHEEGSMTLGGRRVAVSRPRARRVDGTELPIATYRYFADRDPLQRAVMDRMLAGVSTRKFARVGEPVGEQVEQAATSTRKSTVSEMFIEKTRTALEELMARRLDDVRLAVMMLDGLEVAERCHVVALGVTTEGVKVPLGLWEGGRLDRERDPRPLAALRPGQPRPGSRSGDPVRARRREGAQAGDQGRVRRARAGAPLPSTQGTQRARSAAERDRPKVLARIRGAWALTDAKQAERQLETLAAELERSWPDAASSLREGMSETLTLMGLGITGRLAKSLSSTNPIESMIEIVRHTRHQTRRPARGSDHKSARSNAKR